MRLFMLGVLCLGAAVAGAAMQPADDRAAESPDPVTRAIDAAQRAERIGEFDAAALNYLIAHALNPEADGVRDGLQRLAGRVGHRDRPAAPDAGQTHDFARDLADERRRRQELQSEIEFIERTLRDVHDELDRIDRDLDDQSRAEPLAQRLDREINELDRTVSDQQREIDRLRREIDRLWSRVR